MRQIFPHVRPPLGPADPLPGPITAETPGAAEFIAALAACYAYPEDGADSADGADGADGRPWVRANMITSLDGAIAVAGRSGGLSGNADRLMFTVLRGLADVILVGAGTVRAERYRPAKPTWPQLRKDRPPTPAIAVITRALGLDLESELLQGGPTLPRTIVLTTKQAPPDRLTAAARTADVIIAGEEQVSGQTAIEKLAERGFRKVLVEGGPTLLGGLASARLLDELCVTISPLIVGDHELRMIVSRSAITTELKLVTLLEDDGFLLSRYLRNRHAPALAQPV